MKLQIDMRFPVTVVVDLLTEFLIAKLAFVRLLNVYSGMSI